MGKLHKDVGLLIVQSAEDDERSETQVIKVSLPAADVPPQLDKDVL